MQTKPVLEIDKVGNKYWYLNGELHREDGPAVELANGNKYWYLNGELHREDGPAVELTDGTKFWYLNGTLYDFDRWLTLIPLSDQEKTKLILKYTDN